MSEPEAIPVEIYRGQDFYVPAFRVKVQDREIQREMADVVSLTYTDSLDKIDSFEMTINNWDAGAPTLDQSAFKYSDGNLFNPWKDVEIHMGYFLNGEDKRQRMMFGEISTLTPNFPQSGMPTLTVRGVNLLQRFRTRQKVKPFFGKRDTEIAQILVNEIAEELRRKSPQLQLRLDPADVSHNLRPQDQGGEVPLRYVVMKNQYAVWFLMKRARDIGYELTVDPPTPDRRVTLHYRRTADIRRKTYILEWGKSLISFQPSLTVANQVAELTVRGWNPITKREIRATVKRDQVKGLVTPQELGVEEPQQSQRSEIIADHPIQDEAEARQVAESHLRQIGEKIVEGRGKTVGLPELRAGVKIQILGLGRRFSGIYSVTSTTHTIGDGGYTTDFTAKMGKL